MDAGGSCTSVSSTIHKLVYIMNSKVSQNVAQFSGGGMAIQFYQSCFAISVLIHNVSLSRNVANSSLFVGGNIFVPNFSIAGNSITISRSTVELDTSSIGGRMVFLTDAFLGCPSTMINHKPTSVNIVDSTFQHNTARKIGGGLVISLGSESFEYSCCSTEVDITNCNFL